MEKYILQILENNSRVIVPEFGAFIIKQKNPLIIVFNEFLQYNDGVLVDTIAKNEGTDRDSAKKKIDEFIKEINTQLDKGNSFVIDQLGALVKSSTGKISLEKDTKSNSGKAGDTKKTEKKPESSKSNAKESEKVVKEEKKEPVSEKSTVETKKEDKEVTVEIDEKAETKKKEVIESKEEKTEEIIQEKKEKKQESKAEKEAIIKGSKSGESISTSTKKEEGKPQIQTAPPKKEPSEKTTVSVSSDSNTKRTEQYTPRTARPVKEKKKKKTNVWLWVIIILIVNGIIITYFVMSDQLSGLFTKPEVLPPPDYNDMTIEPKDKEEETDEMIIVEPENQQTPEESQIQTPKPQPVITGKRYYVVAGVFREEQNADKLVIELRNKGYNSEKFGKIGNLHAVSFGVYTSREDAEREMRRIKQEENPEAWIKVMQ